jgi:hypothetical protein
MNDPRGTYTYTSGYWSARAEEARTRAEGMHDDTARQTMLGIAEKYDHLAERALKQEKTAKPD